jgi:hypothetical protein
MALRDRQARHSGDGRARLLIAAGLVAAVAVAAWLLPASVRRLDNRAAAGAQLSGVDRELPAARLYGIATSDLVRLAEVIPRDATYTFVYPGSQAHTAELAFPGLAANYLLPRRVSLTGAGARYIVAYHARLHGHYARIVNLGDGVEVGMIAP